MGEIDIPINTFNFARLILCFMFMIIHVSTQTYQVVLNNIPLL